MSRNPAETIQVVLTTTVISSDDNEAKNVKAYCNFEDNDGAKNFSVELFLDQEEPGEALGEMYGHFEEEEFEEEAEEKSEKKYEAIYIHSIKNLKLDQYRHVGTALHEAAFRLSVQQGADGQIRLEATSNAHYFFYRCGFRLETPTDGQAQAYYRKLATIVKAANGGKITQQMRPRDLFLPPAQIVHNKIKYGLLDPSEEMKSSTNVPWYELDPLETYLQRANGGPRLFDSRNETDNATEEPRRCCLII